jgi:hypothetical protein
MSDPNDENKDEGGASGGDSGGGKKPEDDLVEKLVSERVAEALKPIKEKLNKAYSAKEEAERKAAEYEKEKREAELARLKEEGKHKEAYEMQLAAEREEKEKLKRENIALTRDNQVRIALATLNFRNEKANEMAFSEVVGQLVQNDKGEWVHRSGVSVKDFIKAFSEEKDNAFLFKAKSNSGSGGSAPVKESEGSSENGSLFKKPQNELLQSIAEGKFRRGAPS